MALMLAFNAKKSYYPKIMTAEIFNEEKARAFAQLLKTGVEQRFNGATRECVLSEHDGMRLSRYAEETGKRFVKREISSQSSVTQNNHFIEFDGNLGDALRTFSILFSDGPVSIVPSSVIKDDTDGLTIISEWRENVAGLEVASAELKTAVARQLISLASLDNNYHPGLESLQKDMFNVYFDPNSGEKVELLDLDPYLGRNYTHESSFSYPDNHSRAAYVGRVIDLFWDKWCTSEEDKAQVFLAITSELGSLMLEGGDLDLRNPLFNHLSAAQLMKSGFDTRYNHH